MEEQIIINDDDLNTVWDKLENKLEARADRGQIVVDTVVSESKGGKDFMEVTPPKLKKRCHEGKEKGSKKHKMQKNSGSETEQNYVEKRCEWCGCEDHLFHDVLHGKYCMKAVLSYCEECRDVADIDDALDISESVYWEHLRVLYHEWFNVYDDKTLNGSIPHCMVIGS